MSIFDRAALSLAVLLYAACAPERAPGVAEPTTPAAVTATPLAAPSDQADRSCNVVLRGIARRPNGTGGFVTDAQDHWIWFATIDVAAAAASAGQTPGLLYQVGSDPIWRDAPARAVEEGPAYVRYEAQAVLLSAGTSASGLANVRLRVIPYLRLPDGSRQFDHNRVADALAAYELGWTENGFAIAEDLAVCPVAASGRPTGAGATLAFRADGRVVQSGALVAGAPLTVEYDLERLPNCRGTHNGFPAWDLVAHVRFLPAGQVASGSVRRNLTNMGTPINAAEPVPLVVAVPAGARRVELWFENWTGAGSSCRAWDSLNGQNYAAEVLPPVGWIGAPTVLISRGGGTCDGGARLDDGFVYGTWARQRSATQNVCFQVWQAGVTDHDNGALWRQVAVEVHYRFAEDAPWTSAYVDLADRVGNNARYAWGIRGLDPFRLYNCPTVPTTTSLDGRLIQARMQFSFTANGVHLTQANGAPFIATFEDEANAPRPGCP